ncbi:response regulator [Agrobacterium larrymoorei]|uniref:histidine kinase n=1 Tax=Agrobacterium larrymoorei TaxID=160699 RepID=A0ABU0UP20_9HYPH|nr:response regulator [Agrobacterium larrymoorei]MDQ1186718.1 CheY-like chemotaxis protein [Agrobacterium larrymoorei]
MSTDGSLLEKACQGILSLHLPACVKDSELRYVCVNDAYARFAGKRPEDFTGQSSRFMFNTADDVEREDKERRCLVFATDEVATCRGILAEAQTLRCERFIDETGQIFLYEVFEKMPDFDAAPQDDRVGMRTTSDVRQNLYRQNEAERLSEIRTPLNGILRMADALARTDLDARQKTYADTIVQSGNALLRSLDEALNASTETSDSLQTSLFDPANLVEDIATLLAFHAEEKGLTLFTDIDASAEITVEADAARFRQIVTHLVSNAIRFTPKGHIIIRLVAENTANGVLLRLAVEDTGIGMSPEQLASILDQNEGYAPAPSGLAETLRIVSLFDGWIEAESEENKGSVFKVTLPVSVISAQPVTPPWPSDASILVIDGNAISRDILTRHLSDWRLDAYAAEDGTTGLAILEEAVALGLRPAAILLNEDMVDMRADDVVGYLRRHPRMQDIPVILLASLAKAEACGPAQAYIAKPLRRRKLRETLEALLPTPALEDITPPPVTAVVADDQLLQPALQPPPRKGGSNIDVLVAEDNDVNQIVFSQILQQTGLDFRIVGNGKKAVEAWRNENPSLILMDVSMPVMSGYQAAQSIRQMEDDEDGRLGRVPIIGVTAHALDLDSELCLASGMDDYVSKPISPELLRAKISQWLPKGALEAL